ncbi:MAG: sensor histidine kinase [Magnetococcales bacterium]|nr:sensor histidine kinase [Magnetococcales bacterium]
MNPSLQNRLAIGLAAILIPVFLGQWLLMSVAVHRIHVDYIASRLRHDAEALLAALQLSDASQVAPRLLSARINPVYLRPWSGHYYHMQVGETVFRSRSLWDADLTLATPSVAADDTVQTVPGPRQEPLLVLTRHFVKQAQNVTILVAEEIGASERMVEMTQFWYAVSAVLAVGLLLVLQRVMVRRRLRPLEQARGEIHRLEQGTLRHLSTASVPLEILPFIHEINRLLSTLADQLQKSRQASGNLAHTIRTPLTVLLQLTEGAELDDHPALRQQMQQQIKTIGALTGRVLKRVRVAGAITPASCTDVSGELTVLVAMMQQMYRSRSVQIEARIPPGLSALLDREDLLELAGNLLDNACKWARTAVCFTVSAAAGLQLTVEDDGPGCPPAQHEHILERGGRADQTTPGYGIGLAVVQEIVTVYEGKLTLGSSDALGGFQVQVQLEFRSSLDGSPT